MNTRRNPCPSSFRLPTEILEAIFILCARDTYYNECGSLIPIIPGWIKFSYVCRHWRNVALNCPILWTYLSMWPPRWRKESLARSKQAPLNICVNLGAPGSTTCLQGFHFMRQLMDHAERIQQFCLHLQGAYNNLILPKLCLRACRVQTLRVHNSSPSFPQVRFHGEISGLRNLQLIDSPVLLHSFELSGLTTLSLHSHFFRFHQDIAEFLAMLGCMQELEHLDLDHFLASASGFLSSPAFRTFQKFCLPRLARLWIVASTSTVIALLSCVNIPSTTELKLDCCFERGSTSLDDYVPLCSFLRQKFGVSDDPTASGPTIRSLVIKAFSDWGKATLSFSASERDCSSTRSLMDTDWGRNRISIDYSPRTRVCDLIRILGDICCSIPLGNVHSLHVVDPPLSLAFWRKVLGHLPDLRYLKLSAGDMPNLACILSLDSRTNTENQGGCDDLGPDQVFVPALEELELYDVLLPAILPESNVAAPPVPDIQSLYDALSGRKESQGRLTMARCPISNSAFEAELDMAGRWDGGQFHTDSTTVNIIACRP